MPDEDDKKTAKPAEAAGKAPEGPEGEVSASEEGGDADQDAMMAEWEAMAAEGEAEPEGEAAPEAAAPAAGAAKPALRMPAIHEVSLEAYAILGTASMPVSQLLRMGRGAVVELDTGLGRSEEHTSELQSLMRISYAVFCLKKKKKIKK